MQALLRRFRKAKDGLAAVEFAMLLPVMITLFFGVVELSLALACRADVTNMAAAAADLVAQALARLEALDLIDYAGDEREAVAPKAAIARYALAAPTIRKGRPQ